MLDSSEMLGRYGGKNIKRTHRNITLFVDGLSFSYNFQDKHRLFRKQNENFGLFNGATKRQSVFTPS